MAFAYDKLLRLNRAYEQSYTVRDTMLYALGIGAGIGATTPAKLAYVYEAGLQAVPAMATVLAAPGFWQREAQFAIDWQRILHGEQSTVLHKPLPVEGAVAAELTIDAIYDKGAGKGALLYSTRKLYDKASGDLLATIRQGSFLRGNGGQGGLTEGAPAPHRMPEGRPPDVSIPLPTRPEQALIYRLSGDYNPLHADPEVAAAVGFPAPILHGLATYGVACRAILAALCDDAAARLRRLDARFSSPVYPGETILTEIWREDDGKASFRARIAERDTVVINNGYAEYERG